MAAKRTNPVDWETHCTAEEMTSLCQHLGDLDVYTQKSTKLRAQIRAIREKASHRRLSAERREGGK